MALSDSLAELAGTGPATRNRVTILLDRLQEEGSDDYSILRDALGNRNLSSAKITQALRKEYGHDVVKDNSVDAWRRTTNANVTGL